MAPFDYEAVAGLALWRLYQLWQRERKAALRKLHLGHTEFVILANLVWLGTDVSQTTVARTLGLDKMTTSQAARSLAKKALITTRLDPGDRRAHALSVTVKGERLAREGGAEVGVLNERFFAVLGDDRERFVGLMNVLIKQNA